MIQLTEVSKKYRQVQAVDKLTMKVEPGEIYGFLGPNGAGKTTTIKMIAGTLRPTSGQIIIDGYDLASHPEEAKQVVGFIPDRPFIYEKLTGYEFLKFMAGLYNVNSNSFDPRAQELLELFELVDWQHELVESYSHGMKQRLIMSSAMIHRPKILIVDEPMVGLDPRGGRLVKNIFSHMRSTGTTILMSTHTLAIASEVCDRIGIILNGRLLIEGSAESIKAQAGSSQHLEEAFLRLTGGDSEQSLSHFLES